MTRTLLIFLTVSFLNTLPSFASEQTLSFGPDEQRVLDAIELCDAQAGKKAESIMLTLCEGVSLPHVKTASFYELPSPVKSKELESTLKKSCGEKSLSLKSLTCSSKISPSGSKSALSIDDPCDQLEVLPAPQKGLLTQLSQSVSETHKLTLPALDRCMKEIFQRKYLYTGLMHFSTVQAAFEDYLANRRSRNVGLRPSELADFLLNMTREKTTKNPKPTSITDRQIKRPLTDEELIDEFALEAQKNCKNMSGDLASQFRNWFQSFGESKSTHRPPLSAAGLPEFQPGDYTIESNSGFAGNSGANVTRLRDKNGNIFFLKYNTHDKSGEEFQREFSSYQLSELLGLGLIPKTQLRKVHSTADKQDYIAVLQEGVNLKTFKQGVGTAEGLADMQNRLKGARSFGEVQMFDYLIAQTDRHAGNIFVEDTKTPQPKLVLIDNGGTDEMRSFQNTFQNRPGGKLSGGDLPTQYSPEVREKITKLKFQDLRDGLPYLSDAEVEGVWMKIQVVRRIIADHPQS